MNDRVEAQYDDNRELHQDSQLAYGNSGSKIDDVKVETHGAPNRVVNSNLELITELKEEQFHMHNPTVNSRNVPESKLQKTTFNEILTTNESGSGRNKIPNNIPVRWLNGHYSQSDAILLGTPNLTVTSESAREALRVLYSLLRTMEPNVTFQPCMTELRCFGYFTYDFDTCSFVAQIYRVHPSVAVTEESTEYICEVRRASFNGRESFDFLKNAIAVCLQQAGLAEKYANGFEIYPQLSIKNDVGWSSEKCPIHLSTGSSRRLISRVTKRTYPQYSQTLRLLTKCCAASRSNRTVLSENHELSEAVFKELITPSEASACLNALKLIELGVVAPKGILTGIAKSMLVYCAKKPTGFKGMRSQAIENAALDAMKMLSKTMSINDRKEAVQTIKSFLLGKLRKELFREVHGIFQGIH